MDLAARLAEERRARLAAERLLAQKQAELSEANRRLGRHAKQLSQEVKVTRSEVAEVRHEHQRVVHELGEATQRIEVVTDQLWKALKTMQDGFALFDSDGRIELANPSYLSVFDGIETVGPGASYAHVLELMADEGIVDLQGETSTAWQTRMMGRWDEHPIRPLTIRLWNGRFLKMQDRKLPDGGVVSLCVDITGLMRMWSAVEELPDGFVIYDAEDRLLMCNDPYRDIYSSSAPIMVPGTPFEDILRYGLERGQYAEAVGREEAWLEERLSQRRAPEAELEQQLDDGRWIRIYERQTSDGGRVGLRIDITQMKKDQQKLKEASNRAEAANRAKSAFLANMSHEIRTPMNGVVGMADLMMETDLADEQRLYVDTIRSSGEALLVIINDILDYSKIEADKLQLHPEDLDLERAIHEVVMLLQPTARDKNISLLVDYDMFLPTRFMADPGRIRQILTNLLGNAVKFTIEGHVLVRIVGFCEDNGQASVHITVEDTGIGIPEDKINHVFGEFNQVEDDRNRKFEGTGLGLAITRRLIELMGGEVWVESELGAGSCFGMRLTLPTIEPIVYESANVPTHLSHVLVIDDHSANRSIIAKQLEILGLTTDFCQSGSDALSKVHDRPDLIIVEQDLPDMTGQELVAQLRAKGLQVPALLQSAHPTQLRPVPGAEVDAVLQKPVPRRALFAALENIAPYQDLPTPFVEDTIQTSPASPTVAPEAGVPSETNAPLKDKLDVLVAEDNKTNQLVFRKMAGGFDVDLRFANNGLEAVAEYKQQRPDLVFMDISMPEMDGKEATREIRKLEGDGPHVPIIAVTAHAMTGDKESILEAGLDDYLTKPLRKAALGEKIDYYTARFLQDKAS
jgi:signal transduction histidine kinase/CheY-like chemotaxis protein